jgi:hypothetical protein
MPDGERLSGDQLGTPRNLATGHNPPKRGADLDRGPVVDEGQAGRGVSPSLIQATRDRAGPAPACERAVIRALRNDRGGPERDDGRRLFDEDRVPERVTSVGFVRRWR